MGGNIKDYAVDGVLRRDRQTPDEMYFGTGGAVPAELASARKAAREERMKANRAAACSVCFGETDSRALLLQRPRSRMP